MKLVSVKSSMIHKVGFERKTGTLEVVFRTGQVYHYRDVPLFEYEGLMKAKSKGQYMQANIIDFYPYHQVERKEKFHD